MKRSDSIHPDDLPTGVTPLVRQPLIRSLIRNLPIPILLAVIALLGSYVVTPTSVGAYNFELVMQVGIAILMAVGLQLINGYSGQFSLGHAGFMAIGAYLSGYASVTYSHDMRDPASVTLFYFALFVAVAIAAALVLMLFMIARESRRIHSSLPVILMIAIFGWMIFDIAEASRNDHPAGWLVVSHTVAWLSKVYSEILSIGGPGAAKIAALLPASIAGPLCFLVLLICGGLCATAAGFIVGLPALRLRGDYLAIATLGFGEIIRIAIINSPPLGGALGMSGIPTHTTFGWLYACVLMTILIVWRIAYSARGRAIQAVRENEIAAAAVGISPTKQKVQAFVVGSFFAGVGGTLYAHYTGVITPNDFNLLRSIEFVVMVTLGGLASISGAVLAAVVLTLLPELLRNADDLMPAALAKHVKLVDLRMVLYAALLIGMMLLRPRGLLGGKEIIRRRRARRVSPFAAHPKAAMP